MQTNQCLFCTTFSLWRGCVLPSSIMGRGRFTPYLLYSIKQLGLLTQHWGTFYPHMVQSALKSTFFQTIMIFFLEKKRTLIKLSDIVPYPFLQEFAKKKDKEKNQTCRHNSAYFRRLFPRKGQQGGVLPYPTLCQTHLTRYDFEIESISHQQVKSCTKFKHNM